MTITSSRRQPRVIVDGMFHQSQSPWGGSEVFELDPTPLRILYHGGIWTRKSQWTHDVRSVRRLSDGASLLSLINPLGGGRDREGNLLDLAGEPFEPNLRWASILSLKGRFKEAMPRKANYWVSIYSESRGNWLKLYIGSQELVRHSLYRPFSVKRLIATVAERVETL